MPVQDIIPLVFLRMLPLSPFPGFVCWFVFVCVGVFVFVVCVLHCVLYVRSITSI
jgi:hypothetical protein